MAEVAKYATISIHALLAESDADLKEQEQPDVNISIHALLAESDAWHLHCVFIFAGISIHALLAESDFGGTME